jgi:hypothetical protein
MTADRVDPQIYFSQTRCGTVESGSELSLDSVQHRNFFHPAFDSERIIDKNIIIISENGPNSPKLSHKYYSPIN